MTRVIDQIPTMADQQDEQDAWSHLEGETPDKATAAALMLAHKAAEKFPDLAKRYKNFAGPAAVASGALIVLAGIAVARRARKGQKPEEILAQITSDEIEQAATVSSRQNRVWRVLAGASRLRQAKNDKHPSP